MKKTTSGFTIVELLIVIVVIAILAAISVVAYTGIQNRTHDSIVQSDLNNFAKVIQLAHAEDGVYPSGSYIMPSAGVWSGNAAGPIGEIKFSVSRASYEEPTGGGSANFAYCTGVGANGEVGFGIVGQSKSGNTYRYSTESGAQFLGKGQGPSFDRACGGLGYPRTGSFGYFVNRGGWSSWTE